MNDGFEMNAPSGETIEENLFQRLIYMVIIGFMLSIARTLLLAATVIQFIILMVNQKQPNERVSGFGTDLGIWIAKAARYQTAASEVKPWPWSDLD